MIGSRVSGGMDRQRKGNGLERIMKRMRGWIFIWVGLMLLFGWKTPAHAQGSGRILFISSYFYGWDRVEMQIQGMRESIGEAYTLDYEFMGTRQSDDEAARRLFYEGLSYRLSKTEPYDAVILGDDEALLFALEYRDELFPGIPLIFEGVNSEELVQRASQDPLITGIMERLSLKENIDWALKLMPKAKKVVAILDDSLTGEAERKQFYQYADQYPQLEFSEINTSQLSEMEIKNQLWQLDENTILFFIVMTDNKDGKLYTEKEGIHLAANYTKCPMLRMVEAGAGEGILGGYVSSMTEAGRVAGELALECMNRRGNQALPAVADGPSIYYVDEALLDQFKFSHSLIPEGAVLIHHEPSFWEKNQAIIKPLLALIVVIAAMLAWVLWDNVRKRKLLKELEDARGVLESASQHDFLTGLANRSKFMEDLQSVIATETPCSVMMLDIDDFKKINDTFGHTAGDEALKQVAARLKEMQSPLLTPYRFAGDEFILILTSAQSKIVEKTAYACRNVFAKDFRIQGDNKKVTGSIGVASYPQDADNLEKLIVCADDAMYRVKKSGKNMFAYYSQEAADA